MPYRCSIYGLGVVANREIPGVPASQIATDDLRISFGWLPAWLKDVGVAQIENTYTADYKDEFGNPALRVFRLLDGKYYRFSYADQTEFVVDQSGAEVWAEWRGASTIED